MIDTIITSFLNGYTYIRKHPQLLTTVFLIVFVPIAFLFSGQQFLEATRENQERLERERVGAIHDVFSALMQTSLFDPIILQREIESLASRNKDITQFKIGKEEDSTIRIVASLDTESIGTVDADTEYRLSNISPDESLILPFAVNGERFWRSYKRVPGVHGEEYYIYTETSLKHIDTLFSERIMHAYYWLLAILLVVLALIIRHVRLIDYAELYRETKKANEMKDLFTHMIAHELRAPLTAMRGYASMIRELHDVDEETKKYATRIEESAGRLVLIVNDLLDVARMHSGKLSIQNERVNVQKTVVSVLEAMQSSAKEKHIVLTNEGAKNDVFVTADEKRLYQALTNLVSNSIKYTKAGEIQIHLEERADRIEIRVKDTGMGISAHDQKNLFAPFFRVEHIEVDQTVGTGLGMWITKQLIELMHGSIAVESIKGIGTHIVVTLPK